MSEWVKSHTVLTRHRKTKKLARLLDISIPLALGHLHMLWYLACDFAPSGVLDTMDEYDIAEGCQWPGDAKTFVSALVTAGWLEQDGRTIHDWEHHNQQHRERMKAAARQRAKRERDREKRDSHSDITVPSLEGHRDITLERRGEERRRDTSSSSLRSEEAGAAKEGSKEKKAPDATPGQRLVARFVDTYRECQGAEPSSRLKGQWAKIIGEMLGCGHAEDLIAQALDLCVQEGKAPAILELKIGDLRARAPTDQRKEQIAYARRILDHAGEGAARAYCQERQIEWSEVT